MKQIPSKVDRGLVRAVHGYPNYHDDEYGMHYLETNTDYLNKHAEEYEPPLGHNLHLHLIYAHTVHWRVVQQASAVCKIPGRCHRAHVSAA